MAAAALGLSDAASQHRTVVVCDLGAMLRLMESLTFKE
jgi:hypothetical protein